MNSTYFTPQQLEDLAYCLLLSLLDPRAIMVYDLICNVLAAVISSMQQRGLYYFWIRFHCLGSLLILLKKYAQSKLFHLKHVLDYYFFEFH